MYVCIYVYTRLKTESSTEMRKPITPVAWPETRKLNKLDNTNTSYKTPCQNNT